MKVGHPWQSRKFMILNKAGKNEWLSTRQIRLRTSQLLIAIRRPASLPHLST